MNVYDTKSVWKLYEMYSVNTHPYCGTPPPVCFKKTVLCAQHQFFIATIILGPNSLAFMLVNVHETEHAT